MRDDLDEALYRDFPILYRDRHASVRLTPMGWGMCIGDGWEPLLRRLSYKLEAMILALPPEDIDPDIGPPVASQIKEKFGCLRCYVDGATDEMYAAIREAENESSVTCEECGAPGTLGGKGWLKCLCDACRTHV